VTLERAPIYSEAPLMSLGEVLHKCTIIVSISCKHFLRLQ